MNRGPIELVQDFKALRAETPRLVLGHPFPSALFRGMLSTRCQNLEKTRVLTRGFASLYIILLKNSIDMHQRDMHQRSMCWGFEEIMHGSYLDVP